MVKELSNLNRLAHSTVRIQTDTGTGTGFFFNYQLENGPSLLLLVTNKHVVKGAKVGKLTLTLKDENSNPSYLNHKVLELDDFSDRWLSHPDGNVDLCAMLFTEFQRKLEQDREEPYIVWPDTKLIPSDQEWEEFEPVEPILMIGYPNGLWDATNNMPIFRRGITATHTSLRWNSRNEFLIDAATYPGSSGSPVFLYEDIKFKDGSIRTGKIRLLGVIYAVTLHNAQGDIQQVCLGNMRAVTQIPNNLGVVIRSTEILVLANHIKEFLGLQ